MDTIAAWKRLRFILLDKSGFHMTDSLSIAVHSVASRVLICVLNKARMLVSDEQYINMNNTLYYIHE